MYFPENRFKHLIKLVWSSQILKDALPSMSPFARREDFVLKLTSLVPQKWDEGIGMKMLALNETRCYLSCFLCRGMCVLEEGIVLLLVNFWSTTLGGALQVIASDLLLPEVYVPGKNIIVVPRLLTRKARASVVCHLQRKIVSVKASLKKKGEQIFSCFEIYFLKSGF